MGIPALLGCLGYFSVVGVLQVLGGQGEGGISLLWGCYRYRGVYFSVIGVLHVPGVYFSVIGVLHVSGVYSSVIGVFQVSGVGYNTSGSVRCDGDLVSTTSHPGITAMMQVPSHTFTHLLGSVRADRGFIFVNVGCIIEYFIYLF